MDATQPAARAVHDLLDARESAATRRVVSTRDVRKVYRMKGNDTVALGGVTLDIFAGEYLSIMGPGYARQRKLSVGRRGR